MNLLILKLGATGDVVRTTPLLHCFNDNVTWITAAKNVVLLQNLRPNLRAFSWEQRERARDCHYDLVLNLEDTDDVAGFLQTVKFNELFGAYLNDANTLAYTDSSRRWFDLSLISRHGKERADLLKLQNRHTYQELVFDGLGLKFNGEAYQLPEPVETGLTGDIAISREAGPVWPMKNWAYYDELKKELESRGFSVNYLPQRTTLLEHLCDVRNHRCLVGGDSLPMHLALGSGTHCVSLFTCTSPWEIYSYGIQTKIISGQLDQFFYKRTFDVRATTAIPMRDVLDAVLREHAAAKAPAVEAKCK